jgi:hypothetical protein
MAIFAWTTVVFFELVRPPDQTLEIHSTTKRSISRFQHIEAQGEISEPHVSLVRELSHNLVSARSTGGVRDEVKR